MLNVNGSTTNHANRARIIITALVGEQLEYAIRFSFNATNNEVEYEALVNNLKITHKLRARCIRVESHSKLIVDQVIGEYEVREDWMAEYLWVVRILASTFKVFIIDHVAQGHNYRANWLARLASALKDDEDVMIENLLALSILTTEPISVGVIKEGTS